MNWKRGLWRAWVALSVGWVAIVAAVWVFDTSPEPQSTYDVTAPWGQRYEVTAPARLTNADVLAFVKAHAQSNPNCASSDPTKNWGCGDKLTAFDPSTAQPVGPETLSIPLNEVHASLWWPIGLGAIIPLILLGLGYVLGWIVTGFKMEQTRTAASERS